MRKVLLISFLSMLFSFTKVFSNEPNSKWEKVIEAIAHIESRHDSTLISKNGKHVGYLQISKGIIDDCNQKANFKKYSYQDRLSKEKSIEIFHEVQRNYNPDGDIEKAIRLWNGGIGYTIKGTDEYYQKVMDYLRKQVGK